MTVEEALRVKGPTPRARGAPCAGGVCGRVRGTNPAGAGSTDRRTPGDLSVWDQPRGRGEHPGPDQGRGVHPGPTPRARGALGVGRGVVRLLGTNPAGAGSTSGCCCRRGRGRDQPRGRGEHAEWLKAAVPEWGPTPRARGALGGRVLHELLQGTNPAGAGSTRSGRSSRTWNRDQPRGRGEHFTDTYAQVSGAGPTPRARGALGSDADGVDGEGTNPAGAGSTAED